MALVQIEHDRFGRTSVPETRVPHLGVGWRVVDQLRADSVNLQSDITELESVEASEADDDGVTPELRDAMDRLDAAMVPVNIFNASHDSDDRLETPEEQHNV